MIRRRFTIFSILILGFSCSANAFAVNQMGDASLNNQNTQSSQQEQINQISIDQKAKMWGLTTDQYKEYLTEMSDTPSGYWWKDIDPPQVLGMNAKTDEERMQYARIDVQVDQERASKEIDFQHAYDRAFAEAYPRAKIIDNQSSGKEARSASVSNTQSLQSNDRFYLFTPLNDSEGVMLASKIIRLMRKNSASASSVSLNIFFVGDASFEDIQGWAKGNNVPKELPNNDQVTLNHNEKDGSNMLQQVLKTTKVSFPVLVRLRGNRSEVIELKSL